MSKKIIIVIIVIMIIIGGYFLWRAPLISKPAACTQEAKQCPDGSHVGRVGPNCEFAECPAAKENVVVYTDKGYSPAALKIKKGETVIFKNQSSRSMWPASAAHPSHRMYSGTSLDEHCPDTAGIAFDACKGFSPGENWSFKFNKTGTWKYHDHLNADRTGTIAVE